MIKCDIRSCENEASFYYLEDGIDPIAICKNCNGRYHHAVKVYGRVTIELIDKEEYLRFKDLEMFK